MSHITCIICKEDINLCTQSLKAVHCHPTDPLFAHTRCIAGLTPTALADRIRRILAGEKEPTLIGSIIKETGAIATLWGKKATKKASTVGHNLLDKLTSYRLSQQ